MSEELSLPVIEEYIFSLVSSRLGVDVRFDKAVRVEECPGSIIWEWEERGPGLRSWKSFALPDEDGAAVVLALLRRGDRLAEIELWRGDGRSISALPPIDQVKNIDKPGVISFKE